MAPLNHRNCEGWMIMELLKRFFDCLLGTAQFRRHHRIARDKNSVLLVDWMNQAQHFRHTKEFYGVVQVLGIGNEPHHLWLLLLVHLSRNYPSKNVGIKALLEVLVIGIILLFVNRVDNIIYFKPILWIISLWRRLATLSVTFLLLLIHFVRIELFGEKRRILEVILLYLFRRVVYLALRFIFALFSFVLLFKAFLLVLSYQVWGLLMLSFFVF